MFAHSIKVFPLLYLLLTQDVLQRDLLRVEELEDGLDGGDAVGARVEEHAVDRVPSKAETFFGLLCSCPSISLQFS